ncbi:hypothetical protein GIB67_001187 [Kingdonia uniflora]|uniref:Uncharacterized protein n=1 Tax=Kingdonia uniflora TaxID=39325 RepID=A0A7J7LG69_9MAGN|nr:hypothetical protein GIB67_001187 [Kingdonia uniflora]
MHLFHINCIICFTLCIDVQLMEQDACNTGHKYLLELPPVGFIRGHNTNKEPIMWLIVTAIPTVSFEF